MRFVTAHSSAPDWPLALEALVRQVAAARARADTVTRPSLGLVYADSRYAGHVSTLIEDLRDRLGVAHWAGAIVPQAFADAGTSIEPCAVAVMLLQVAQRDFKVFSGRQPLPAASRAWRGAHSVLAHGDPGDDDLDELLAELAERTQSGDVWGGVVAAGHGAQLADAVLHGGLSGVAWGPRVGLLGGLSQGLQPVGPARTVTRCADNVVYALDGQPALGALLEDLGEPSRARQHDQWRELVPSLREVVVGLSWPQREPPAGGGAVLRGLIGIDPGAQGVALAADLQPGMQLRFCRRQQHESMRDLLRVCTEVRDELEQRREACLAGGRRRAADRGDPVRGAVYISCASRSDAALHAELRLLRSQLGVAPLIGFSSAGEFCAGRLHAYSAVLRVFANDPAM